MLTEDTYTISMSSYQFCGWPDGQCLIEQEQCVIDITKIVLLELIKEFAGG
jgi:hypothetical protein